MIEELKMVVQTAPPVLDEINRQLKVYTRTCKYMSYVNWKKAVKGKFVHCGQYREWVLANNLQNHGFPLKPESVFKKDGYQVDDAFGNPPGTFRKWQSEEFKRKKIWQQGNEVVRQKAKETSKPKPVKAKTETKHTETLTMSAVCEFLISRKMYDVVKYINLQQQLTLEDSRQITTILLGNAEDKLKVKV
jgi:hypothetical protein